MTAEVVHDCLLELSQEAKGRDEHLFSIGSKYRGASINYARLSWNAIIVVQ